VIQITKELYRRALHFYLIHAFPDDDLEYYSRWAWMVGGHDFWDRGFKACGEPEPEEFPFPREVRFGCHVSGNTKLCCYPTGFTFDTNHVGDPPDIVAEVKRLKQVIEDDWERHGIPVHGRGQRP